MFADKDMVKVCGLWFVVCGLALQDHRFHSGGARSCKVGRGTAGGGGGVLQVGGDCNKCCCCYTAAATFFVRHDYWHL